MSVSRCQAEPQRRAAYNEMGLTAPTREAYRAGHFDEPFHEGRRVTAPLRVGVVGCGLIAQVMHLRHLRELADRFEVVALCDVAPEPLEFAGRMFPAARRHAAWSDLLAEPLDAVLVLTPGSHAPVAIAAAELGLHVFVEKPMCFSVPEGEAMIAAADGSGVALMVGYMKRYDPAYQQVAATLERESLSFARITTLESPIEPYALHHPLSARGTVEPALLAELVADDERRLAVAVDDAAGPAVRRAYRTILLDSMIHELNGVRGLLGEPDVLHFARIWGDPPGVTVSASFGGVEVVFMWIDLPGAPRYLQDWSFYGPLQRTGLIFPSPLLHGMPTELVVEGGDAAGIASWRTEHTVSYDEAFKRELVEFHAAISEGRGPATDGEDGLRDVALAQAIVRCHVEGAAVAEPSAAAC
jgi:predicted dehydrogenase